MSDLLIKVLESGREKFRHSAQETVDFTMVKVSGTPTNNTDVMTKGAVAGAYVPLTQKGATNGVASLDSGGKIPAAQLPNSVMEYKGSYDPTTNTPKLADTAVAASKVIQDITYTAVAVDNTGNLITIEYTSGGTAGAEVVTVVGNAISIQIDDTPSTGSTATQVKAAFDASSAAIALASAAITGTAGNVQAAQAATNLEGGLSSGNAGDVYRVSATGAHDFGSGSLSFVIGDYVIFNGTIWEKSHAGADAVQSVNSKSGVVVLNTDDISEPVTPTNKWFTEARVRASVLTGLSTATGGTVAATDTVLEAFGKLENRTALNDAKVSYSASTARSDLIETASITDGETNKAPCSNLVFDALAGKSDTSHNHAGVYAPVSHNHAISDVTNLSTELAAKALISDEYMSLTNKELSAITVRQFVYLSAEGQVKLAKADALATCGAKIGIVRATSIDADAAGNVTVKRSSRITGFTGLTAGSLVYLSPGTAGGYTQTCPSTVGQFILVLGEALSTTEIEFNPGVAVEIAS